MASMIVWESEYYTIPMIRKSVVYGTGTCGLSKGIFDIPDNQLFDTFVSLNYQGIFKNGQVVKVPLVGVKRGNCVELSGSVDPNQKLLIKLELYPNPEFEYFARGTYESVSPFDKGILNVKV